MATIRKIVFITPSTISDRYNNLANSDFFDVNNNLSLEIVPSNYKSTPFFTQEQHPGILQTYTTVKADLYQFELTVEDSRKAAEYVIRELGWNGATFEVHDYHEMSDRTIEKLRTNQDRGYAIRQCQLNSIEPVGGIVLSEDYGALGLGFRVSFTQVDYD